MTEERSFVAEEGAFEAGEGSFLGKAGAFGAVARDPLIQPSSREERGDSTNPNPTESYGRQTTLHAEERCRCRRDARQV